jgi:PAS domain S-box-containing protein
MNKSLTPLEKDWQLSEGVFHTLTEEANDAIFLIKTDGVFLYGNQQAVTMLGVSKEELVKMNYTEIIMPEDLAFAASQFKLIMEGKPNNTEIRVRKSDGEIFIVNFSSVKIVVDGQDLLMTIGKDITARKLAEEKLLEMNVLFTNAQRIGRLGSWDFNPQKGSLVWSDCTCELFGVRPEEFAGTIEAFQSFVLPEDLPALQADRNKMTPENPILEVEYRIRRRDGQLRWLFEKARADYDGQGNQTRRMGIVVDITERKLAREKTHQNEAMLRMAGEIAHLGGWMVELPGAITWSDEARAIYGLSPEFPLTSDIVNGFYGPKARGLLQAAFDRCAGEGIPFDLEVEMTTAKGKPAWVRSIGRAEKNSAGQITRVQGTIQDITDRKTADESLRRSEENLRVIIGEMPNGLFIIDSEKIIFANRTMAQLVGLSSEKELLGKSPFDFVHSDFHSIMRERFENLAKDGGANPSIRSKVIGKEGRLVEVETRSLSIQFDGKQNILVIMRDVTQQNQMERQATLNDKLATVGTLAAGVAHEVNNPLSYVLANLVFLQEQLEDIKRHLQMNGSFDGTCQKTFEEMKGELADIAKGSEKIRDIVKGLKAFVRANDDELEKVDLNQAVESAINMSFHIIKQKARVEKDFAVDLPHLIANSGKLQQVFINLLINAAQSMEGNKPEKNKISIRTGRYDGIVFVEFKDTGVGIPEKILPRIFDPFFTTKPTGVGTGLGLSVSNEILNHYGGTIEVQSTMGKGSTFTVKLPRENGQEVAAVNPVLPVEVKRGRVLIVDDEPGNLDVLCKILKKNGTVLSALSGLDAMGIIEREVGNIEAILSDINMPDMNGVDLYKNVAKKFPGLEKRIIFITGGIFSEEIKDFLKTIPNTCMEKPFNLEEVRKTVSEMVDESLENEDRKKGG